MKMFAMRQEEVEESNSNYPQICKSVRNMKNIFLKKF